MAHQDFKYPLKFRLKIPLFFLGILVAGGVLRAGEQNVWSGVYWLHQQNISGKDGEIYYIDPGKSTADTYAGTTRSFGVNVTGGGTLVLGNKSASPSEGGKILFGGTGWQAGYVGYITGNLSAPKIYLTNTIQSGNAWATGGGTTLNFQATQGITANGLNFNDNRAGTQHSSATFNAGSGALDVTNSTFNDQAQGSFNFSGQNTIFNNTSLTGYQTSINVKATQALEMQDTNSNNSYGSVTLQGSSVTLSKDSFQGDHSKLSISASNALSATGVNISGADSLQVNANSASFTNSSFNTTGQQQNVFKTNSLTLNNTTWSGSTYYKFEAQNGGTSTNTTFSGTTTISTDSQSLSPFANLKGKITLSPNAIINIKQSLGVDQSYTLFNQEAQITSGDKTISQDQALWKFLSFNDVKASSIVADGSDSSIASFNFGGRDYRMKSSLVDGKLTFTMLTGYVDLWNDVYNMTPGCSKAAGGGCVGWPKWTDIIKGSYKNYNVNVGDGIAYINPVGKTLNTWTFGGNGGIYNIQGNGATLVIGNDKTQVATGGIIHFGKAPNLGYIEDTFQADNIYMTNTINVGTSSLSGGGAYMSFKANKNFTIDGLTYHNYVTAIPPFNTILSQHSRTFFDAGDTLSISNSSFEDDSEGSFGFNGSTQVSFNQSSVQGSKTAITIYSPKATINNSAFFLGNGASLDFNQGANQTGYLSSISANIADSTLNLNQQSHVWFHGNATLNNTVSFLNLSSSADFYGPTTLSGTTILNLDHNSTITFYQGATLSDNANLNLINSAKATFTGNTTFNGDSGITLTKGTSATFNSSTSSDTKQNTIPNITQTTNPSTTFSGQSFLNVSGEYDPSKQTQTTNTQNSQTINYQAQFKDLNFKDSAALILNNAAIQSGKSTFSNNVGVSMANSLLNAGTLTLQGGNFLLQNSKVQATSGTASGNTDLNLQSNSQFTFSDNFNLNGALKFSGFLNGSNTQPLIKVDKTFELANSGGLLNIANIDLSAPLTNDSATTYDILQAKEIKGISGADGYSKIDFYGIKIDNATYSTSGTSGATTQTQSWSFTNPLDGAQTITEEIKDGKLTIKISKNSNPVATSYYNIAPELYFYEQSKQNTTGADFNYSDDRTGTFFLDSNLKGVFRPKGADGKPGTPIVPGTYNAYGQPLQGLYISNSLFKKDTFNNLYNIASSLYPQLENLIKGGILNDLNDPNKALQALLGASISLTDEQKTQLLGFINGLNSHINQTFKNGTLAVGTPQAGQTGSSSVVWFGGNGYSQPCSAGDFGCQSLRNTNIGQLISSSATAMGYIQAQFNAKDIYITGTVGSGNAWGMGGSADVTFNSATNLTLNDAKIQAQATDGIFNLLGQGGVEKLVGQKGLSQMLGNYIYSVASGSGSQIFPGLIPNGIKDALPAPLSKDLGDKLQNLKLSDFLTAQDMGALLQMPGMENVIKDILSTKTVSSVLGNSGLIHSLSQTEQNRIFGEIDKKLPLGGSHIIATLANGIFGNRTLLSLIGSLSPMTGMNVNNMLNFSNTAQGQTALNNFLKNNTFGQVFEGLLTNADLLNKTIEWLGPQILSEMIKVALQDTLNPSKEMTSAAENIGEKIITQIFGAQAMDTLKNLQQDQDVQKVIQALIAGKGLGGIWANGLGSILPPSLQQTLQKAGVGSLLAPKALSNFWEKGYFNFLANGDVVVSNSSFSNATGGDLNFVAGKQIIFMGNNSISFSNSQGTLNFFSNNTSNINLTTLNASNGLNINAQFNNLFVQNGTITTTNPYESLVVNAQNFYMGGTIDASQGGNIDLSKVTQNTQIGTIKLGANASLSANDLEIIKELNNASSNALNVAQNFDLYSGATLSTGVGGINVGGNLNSYGTMTFNSNAQNINHPFISVDGVATLNPSNANAFTLKTLAPTQQQPQQPQQSALVQVPTPQTPTPSTQGVYTLINANKWVRYGLVNQAFNPNSWKDYLTLYTYLDIDGQKLQLNAQGDGLTYNGQAVQIGKDGLLVSYKNQAGQMVSASIAYNKMQVGINQALNTTMPNVQNYIQQIQGQNSVNAIYQAGGPRVMNWLQQLLINTKDSPLFAPYYLEDHSIKELVQVAKDIANSIDLIASPNLKANSTDILRINTYTQQMSRLTKLSSPLPSTPSFADMLESLKGKKFASAVPNAMDVILKYSQRDVLKNNLWMQGVGGASFVAGGTGTLYGINVGYDRFIKGVIVGGYAAYGYSNFRGNIANSGSNNVNVGLYSRIFVKRSEITLSANETWGYNKTYIQASNPLLSIINQRYDYNTWTTNVNANYGYDFFFKNKHVVLKPQVALRYYYIGLSGLQGVMDNPLYAQFKANADPAKKSVLTLNLALESRHYFGKNSYYFVLADIGRDLFVRSSGDKLVRFIGDDTLSYRKGGLYNTFVGLTTGGEVRLWRSLYINAGIGARFGLNYQDINVTGNVGMRYAF
nr:vacuolating cytotoxin domain-containing protein [Helicobacter felis]